MLTVKEVCNRAGVSARTLHHYDEIGLLVPSERTEAGYRLYSSADLERLQQIMLLRELEFSLSDIRRVLDAPDFDRKKALEQQIELLELKRKRIKDLIELANSLIREEGSDVSFEAFDTTKIDEYAARAKEAWGKTQEYADYERKSSGRSREEEGALGDRLLELFKPFGKMAAEGADPASQEAMTQAGRIREFITEHFYTCSIEVFAQLGQAYGAGGEFTENIDKAAGAGASEFAAKAVEAYCAQS